MSTFSQLVEELDADWSQTKLGSLIFAAELDSTNLFARRLVEEFQQEGGACPEVTVLALKQTAGRGRQGRSWISQRGLGAYLTIVREIAEDDLQTLPLLTGVGIARTLRSELACEAELKWPNDIHVGGRKIGGILIETVSNASGSVAALIGLGLNHGHTAAQLPTAVSTSLRLEVEAPPPLSRFVCSLVAGVSTELVHVGDKSYANRSYQELTAHRQGDSLRCRVAGEEIEGTFLGFDGHGFLRLEIQGQERLLTSGEVIE